MAWRAWLSWAGLLAGTAALPAALWWSTTERHVRTAAALVAARAAPSDLVLISGAIGGAQPPDRAGLMRPFGSRATVVVDPAGPLPDLSGFPNPRAFLVGPDFERANALGPDRQDLGAGVQVTVRPDAQATLMETLPIARIQVVREGQAPLLCRGAHPSGGVRCGNQPWQYVGPVVVPAHGQLHACLWAHPVPDAQTWMDLPADTRAAHLWLQYADEALRDPPRTPLEFAWEVHGVAAGRTSCQNTGSGRCPVDIVVPAAAQSTSADAPTVRLKWWAGDTGRQLVCLGGLVERSHGE